MSPDRPDAIRTLKSSLREAARAAVSGLSPPERRAASARIVAHLEAWVEWRNSILPMGFLPMSDEPDLTPLLLARLQARPPVALPKVDATGAGLDLVLAEGPQALDPARRRAGPRGTAHPEGPQCRASEVDLVLVPGRAFDRHGGRLGRGGGFYDRFLPELPASARLVAVAFECQMVASVPMEAHDRRVAWICTETGLRPVE